MNYRLVSAIRRHPWHIDSGFVKGQMQALAAFLEGKIEFTVPKDIKPYSMYQGHTSGTLSFTEVDETDNTVMNGLIAVTNIIGPTMKYDEECGPIGTIRIGQNLKMLDANPDVKAHVIRGDSPGGMADGTSDLSEIIQNLKKPKIGFISGYGCSAFEWIVSSCDIVIASPLSLIGSIGTMASFEDFQPALEKLGVQFHDILAPQSVDKNKVFDEVMAGKYENYQKDILQPLAQEFIDAMKKLRPNVKAEHLTGKTWYARDMVGILVDKLGNFDDALAEAYNAIKKSNSISTSNTNSNQIMTTKPFSKLEKKLGSPIEMADGGAFFNEAQLQTIEDSLTDEGEVDTPVVASPVNAAPPEIVEDPVIASLKSENASLKLQNINLQNKLNVAPATTPAAPKVENALFPTVSEAPTAVDEVNSFVKQL